MDMLQKYIPMVKFIASILGQNAEVLLHDVRNPENSILAIENGHISGRRVGGVLTDLVLKTIQNKENSKQDFISNYVVVTKDKHMCQSSSFFIKDDKQEIIGVLCVNIDISSYLATKDFLDNFVRIKPPKHLHNMLTSCETIKNNEIIHNNSDEGEVHEHLLETSGDVVNHLIEKVIRNIPIAVERMSQDEKIEVVRELNELGLFMFKGGVSELARRLKVSDATVYRYLSKVKSED